ncbi:MAG: SPOR domain-containing protein [Gallionella sp.]|jgi:DedD protein|nr:SPOR domain-containing protein [Gallionella sp.]
MAKELSDEELNLKIKARRRLIGAVALTLAVVVILPMVLESEPKSGGQDIELRIPSPEEVPPLIPAMPVPEPLAEPAANDVAVPPASPVPVMVAAPEKPATEAPALPKPAVLPAPASASAEKPVVSTENVAAGGSYVLQVGAYSNASTAKKQYAQLKSWGFKAYTEKSGNTTRVRVGPYTERDKVDKVSKLLENHGLKPSIVTLK